MPDSELWWALEHLPAGELRMIRLMWHGLRIENAARTVHPRTKELTWCRRGDDGELIWLPPGNPRGAPWPEEPDCWAPTAKGWTWPGGKAPEPLPPHHVPRLWGARQGFGAVDEAEAADLAREMEADRQQARSGAPERSDGGRNGQGRALWWMADGLNLRHDPAGQVERRDAEARLMRALASDGGGTLEGAPMVVSGLLAEIGEDACRRLAEIELRTPPEFRPPFRPLPTDTRDYLTAMSWYRALLPKHQVVTMIASRTVGYSFRDIADAMGIKDRRRSQELYTAAIDEAHEVANGWKTAGVKALDAQMAAVRERNQAARRR